MASGGYRKPTNPAPASGPGRLSKRTDGGPGQKLMVAPGMPYGDRQGLLDQEKTSAMSQADNITPAPIAAGGGAPAPAMGGGYSGAPFGGPTMRPNEPVTAGVDIGHGPGQEAIIAPPAGIAPQPQRGSGVMAAMFQKLSASDMTGALAPLYQAALTRGV